MDKRERPSGTAETKEDRRAARSRKALSDAFVSLLREKPYAKISIRAIADRADVGRSTFYEHFENKEQLMLWGHDHLKELLLDGPGASAAGIPRLRFLGLFRHLQENRDLAQALGRGPSGEVISGFLRDALRRKLESQGARGGDRSARLRRTLAAEAAAAGLVAALWRWVKEGMPAAPEAMAEFCEDYLARIFRPA